MLPRQPNLCPINRLLPGPLANSSDTCLGHSLSWPDPECKCTNGRVRRPTMIGSLEPTLAVHQNRNLSQETRRVDICCPEPPAPPSQMQMQTHTPARTSQCWSRQTPAWTRSVHLDAPGQRHGQQPVSGKADPGVVKHDKSSRGSVDTTKTRSDPQRVRMSSGERPIGAAKGKHPNAEALCHYPPPPEVCFPEGLKGLGCTTTAVLTATSAGGP